MIRRTDQGDIEFRLMWPDARAVFLSGDFNDWNPQDMPMLRETDGTWVKRLRLNRGTYTYTYLVDGRSCRDDGVAGNSGNGQEGNCVLVVG